ncbi:hypothetical protein JW766_01255 [Candidatus Dojkabacteria bacterium]|nr:hypothetical protein [Candidatus Dojkabacteria bacterium]
MNKKTNLGKLFIVGTPIGNLQDTTLRAIKILKEADFILAEDTRKTSVLLRNFNIGTPMISYRDQNHKRVFSKILSLLSEGKNLALVSDSGTPVISDPGFKLIKELRESDLISCLYQDHLL